jgi:hypothetical protein
MLLQPANQFEQRRQISRGLQAAGHLATEVSVDRPRGNRLTLFRTLKIEILQVPTTELAHDTEVMLTEKRMKRVPNRNFALVTGIMTCRLKRELQRFLKRLPPPCRMSDRD